MCEFSYYRSGFLAFRGLSEASSLAAADAGGLWFLAISMKVFIKSWKSTGAGGPGTGAGIPGAGVLGAGVPGAGEPAPL